MHNYVELIGKVEGDPWFRIKSSGKEIMFFQMVTTERWFSKKENETHKRDTVHQVVIFSPIVIKMCKNIMENKSSLIVQGKIRYSEEEGAEIVVDHGGSIKVFKFNADEVTPIMDKPKPIINNNKYIPEEIQEEEIISEEIEEISEE